MKSSIKIDYERSYENNPVIKITIPDYGKESTDEDIRDKLMKDFLHSPMKMERNTLFELNTYGNLSNSTLEVCTISPIKYENVIYKLRHIVLNRLVPYNDIVLFNSKLSEPNGAYKKVHEFFDWVDKFEKERGEKEVEPNTLTAS
jgi:hypothetical protein